MFLSTLEHKSQHYSNTNAFIRNTNEAIEWEQEIRKRDGKLCQKCKTMYWDIHRETFKGLQVHHDPPLSYQIRELNISPINYKNKAKELFDINKGYVVCDKCHKKLHFIPKKINL